MLRVILDASILRRLLHGQLSIKHFFAIPGSQNIRYSIAPYFYAEFVNQVSDSLDLFEKWQGIRHDVDALIDRHWPVLPHGYSFGVLAGVYENDGTVNCEKLRSHFEEQWFAFITSPNLPDLLAHTISRQELRSMIHRMNLRWVDWITETREELVKRYPDLRPSKEQLYQLVLDMTERAGDRVKTGEFFEAYYRLLAFYTESHLYSRDGYNPRSEKNYGDMIDMEVLQYAPLPIIYVTHDKTFKRRVKSTGSEFKNRILIDTEFIGSNHDHLESLLMEARKKLDAVQTPYKKELQALVG